ncbi:PH domain-containing protein [Bacillus bingmayongensis]|uniref:PH domain-containing protein n=1 Tax=Bacillus bingmayongensis TaxID=1150157 RepID=UPI0002E65BBF|nr:PH domain-containing protein [Bacillus bingmayongensis]MBY0595924.1 PH domain-containing protein [Bacillus bingmayongensis]UXM19935.1 PH domain-containing protein [Bacillus thuringiensis]
MKQELAYDQIAQRMHPLWMLFSMVKSIKELILWIVFFAIFISSNSNPIFLIVGVVAGVVYLIYNFVSIFLDWKHFKYVFTDKEMYIYEGRFIKENRFIPLERIQGISQNTHFFHRLFGLTSLLLETGSNEKKSSIKLEMITYEEAARIQEHLGHIGFIPKKENESDIQQVELIESKDISRDKHYKMAPKEILVKSLMSLKLLLLIPLIQEIYSNINDFISIDGYINEITSFFQKSWFLMTLGILILLIMSLAYGIIKTYIQYGNFEVTSDQHRIFVRTGVFNETEFSIPKEKIQAININTNLLKRWFGLVQVKIISITDMEDKEMRTAKVLFPLIDKNRALSLIPEILPTFKIDTRMISIPKYTIFIKMVRLSYIWIISTILTYYFWSEFWYIPIILFVLVNTSQILNCFYSGYKLNGEFIQLQRGGFSTNLFITNRKNIEELKIIESGIQSPFGLVTLQTSTRAKPVKKTKILDIPKDVAVHYYHWYGSNKKHIKAKKI